MKPTVQLFLRKSVPGRFSIEALYQSLLPELVKSFDVKWNENRRPSKGFFFRFFDAIDASFKQGQINHVTGDVHYLTYFMRRSRTILTIHDFVGLETSSGLKRSLLWLMWYWLPSKRVAAIVVISRATETQLHRYLRVDPKLVHLIPNPVNPDFKPTNRVFDCNSPRILQVGTGKNKNLERHAQAIAKQKCCFVVLGKPTKDQIALLRRLKINFEIHYDLTTNAVVELYQSCDLLLFGSTYEGFGMPIIEAQACGLPVVTSRLWSMPEVAGDGALIVDPFDLQGLRNAVRDIVGSPALRCQLREKGFANVRKYEVKSTSELYGKLYRSVL
jgi:glycosyltransferase involved in cell wall biosynthesis